MANTMSQFVVQSLLLSCVLALPAWPRTMPAAPFPQNQPAQKDSGGQPDQQSHPAQPDQKQDQKAQGDQPQSDKQDQGDSSSSSSSSSSAAAVPGLSEELQQKQPEAKYDPFPAEQDVEVGIFYMHKGDSDAAIARFEDAIQLRSNFAKPRLLLAQIYEKKGDKANAVKYYKEYLQVYSHAPDAAKIQKKIEKLSGR
jgi:tetratricopeptide (TPR) repeat protein